MKRLTLSLLALCYVMIAIASVKHYAWKGQLGTSINFKLEVQENEMGAIAGQTTYYRKNGKISVIPVYGHRINYRDATSAIALNEYEGTKICGTFYILLKEKTVIEGNWHLMDRSYKMYVQNVTPNQSQRFLQPITSLTQAKGEYSFTYDCGLEDPCGGSCTLKVFGNKLKWDMVQVTPNIAEGTGTSMLQGSKFGGKTGNFHFVAYVDKHFVYVKRINDGPLDDFGAHATLEGIYVREKQ